MKKIFILLISMTECCFILAQTSSSQKPPKVIPPSPNVAALQRYGDIPVSPYTGVPEISIPLYEIKAGDITVPVSISYHASGIKVSDEASRVGLGWALNAGGVISRTIIGEDDFKSTTFGYHITNTTADIPAGPKAHLGRTFNIQSGNTVNVGGISNLPNLLGDGFNFQPDIYTFNFLGYSGKFYLKRNKEVVLAKKEKIRIKCLDENGNSWEVTTADGMKFLFEEYENYTDNENSTQPKTAWYLTKIVSSKGETVTFEYIAANTYIRPTGSFFESNNPVVVAANPPAACGRVADNFPSISQVTPGRDYKNLYLNKVSFNNGEVKFLYSNDRVDIANDLKLSEVKIFNKGNNNSLSEIKKWNFIYSYFTGNTTNSFLPVDDKTSKRLRLDTLWEKDALGSTLVSPYVFSYNSNISNQLNLPPKTSYSRDHWGYFNGKNNFSLIPDYTANMSGDIAARYLGIQGNNRDTDPNYVQLFMLNEIKYPTGGKTLFDYESHDFDLERSKVNDNSYFSNYKEAYSKTINKNYIGPYSGNLPTPSDLPNKILDLTDMVVGANATTSRVDLKGFFRFNTTLSSCYFPSGAVYMTLTKEDGTIISGPTDLAYYLGATSDPKSACTPPDNPIGIQFSNSYNLTPGKYVWKLTFYSSSIQIQDVTLKIDYTATKENQKITNSGDILENTDFAGGLRIKRISDYDNITAALKIKRYYYHYAGSDGKKYSYGRRMSRPIYTYYDDSWTTTDCGATNTTDDLRSQHLIRQSDSNIPLNGSASGSVVGYDTVIISYGENGEYGKSEYRFDNKPDVVWDYSEADQMYGNQTIIPRKPPILTSYSNAGNGNIISQAEYVNRNGAFIKVKEVTNTYTEQLAANNVLWYGIEKRNYNNAPYFFSHPFRAYVYPTLVEGRNLLTSSVVTTYDAFNPNLSLSQTTNYTYNNNTHLQLTSASQTTSKGPNFITDYTYPQDYADADCDAAILEMKGSRFNHSAVITKKTNVSSEINKFQIKNGLVLPLEIAILENTTALSSPQPTYQPASGTYPTGFKPRIKFEDYDASGNILQVKKADDVMHSYIWGYNNTYPIAEVTNAYVKGVAYTSFEANSKGNWNFTGSIANDLSAPTGKGTYSLAQPGGNIVSQSSTLNGQFIVSFWLKNTSGTVTVNGSTSSAIINRSGWSLYTVLVTVSNAAITISGTGTIDEVRLYPEGAQMTTFTYDPLIGNTSKTDLNNKTTYYEYDNFGRLMHVRDQNRNIIKKYCYNYAGQPVDCKPTNLPGVYAKISYENQYNSGGLIYGNVVLRLYQNEACTAPLSVNNMAFNYNYYFPCYESQNSFTQTVSVTGNFYTLKQNEVLSYSDTRTIYQNGAYVDVGVQCFTKYYLINDPAYQIVQ